MNVTLTGSLEALVQRLVANGQFRNPTEAVEAGLRKLDEDVEVRTKWVEKFEPGSLRKSFTNDRNNEELKLVKGSSLVLENDEAQMGNLDL